MISSVAILWFLLSILIILLEDKNQLMIARALFAVLCVSGIFNLMDVTHDLVNKILSNGDNVNFYRITNMVKKGIMP
ncbi:hypothetical protein [uncultured Methanobrevibacter sp.]|uniref:hypothetical protein n=1 Tax=uncultured Methanobrevibacter sp. TaxID=253161 RepID=UPI0025F0572D|nr:hypothetical protein [uncultured Methanobrevibacter sp.]